MWTKCYSADGSKVFYYNSAKNESSWTAPPDSIVHEAINLKPPRIEIDERVENNEQNYSNTTTLQPSNPSIDNSSTIASSSNNVSNQLNIQSASKVILPINDDTNNM